MTVPELYTPQKDSPSTYLTSAASLGTNKIYVADTNIFQNAVEGVVKRLTLGFDSATTETVEVNSYNSENEIELVEPLTNNWGINTKVARVFTSYDLSEIHQYLEELNNNVIDLTEQNTEFNTTILGFAEQIENEINPIIDLLSIVEQKKQIYRGTYLGEQITEPQNMAIKAGTFDGLYIGDYWRLNNINYRIADFNYWTHGVDQVNSNHVVLIPDNPIAYFPMNEDEPAPLYFDTTLRTYLISTILPLMNTTFKMKLCAHSENLPSIFDASNINIVSSKLEIMSESQVYGQGLFREREYPAYRTNQFALFKIAPRYIYSFPYWLRDRCDTTSYSAVSDGMATTLPGINNCGIRPAIAIFGSTQIIG